MAKAAARRRPAGFLPHGTGPILRRLGNQFFGLVMIALGLAAVAALVTYDPRDPSLNTAATGAVANALGRGGGYGADALLQTLGLAAWLPALAVVVWGARLVVAGAKPEKLWLRIGLLVSGALLLDIGLARLPIPAHSLLPGALGGTAPSVGGVAGRLLLSGLGEAAGLIHVPVLTSILAVIGALFGLVCLNYAFGISSGGWRQVGRGAWTASRFGARGLGWIGAASVTTGGRALAATRGRAERREPGFGEMRLDETGTDDTDRGDPMLAIGPEIELPDDAEAQHAERIEPLVVPRAAPVQPGKRERESRQKSFDLKGEFERPPIDLLTAPPVVSSSRLDDRRGGPGAKRPPARISARRFRCPGQDIEGAARPGGDAL